MGSPDKLAKTAEISRLFAAVHEQLSAPDAAQVNRAEAFLRLLEINSKVAHLFDQSETGFGPKGVDPLSVPSGPGNGDKATEEPAGAGPLQSLGKFRDRLAGLEPAGPTRKFVDMHDVVDMHSDKGLPDFLHKLNLRLNLYEPDLKFATIHKKWADQTRKAHALRSRAPGGAAGARD